MTQATANGIQIEYDTFGDRSGRPLLLINGFGSQLISWPEDFCTALADRGHFVIRFDNRDVGLSSKIEQAGIPDMIEAMRLFMRGERIDAPYTHDDMADDSVGLLDALGIDRAHVCGISMGGMIAQTVAIRHPSRVASLISMASTTGNPEMPQGTPEAVTALLTPLPEEREAAIKHLVEVYRILAGPNSPFDVVWTRSLMTRVYERSFYPPGRQRQLVANMASGNRKPALARVTAPTLVIHGADDPIIPVEHGKDTAEAIPGAELLILEGLGHLLHFKGAWPRIVEPIAAHTKNAA